VHEGKEDEAMEEEDWQRDLIATLAQVVLKSKGLEVGETLDLFQEIEARFLALVAGNEFREQETRRRVGEFLLVSSTDNRYPLTVCRHFFEDLSRLGFLHPDKRWRYTLIYSRYCITSSHFAEALRTLKALEAELQAGMAQLAAHFETTNAGRSFDAYLALVRDQLKDLEVRQLDAGGSTHHDSGR
jgi:hypothetical protein